MLVTVWQAYSKVVATPVDSLLDWLVEIGVVDVLSEDELLETGVVDVLAEDELLELVLEVVELVGDVVELDEVVEDETELDVVDVVVFPEGATTPK